MLNVYLAPQSNDVKRPLLMSNIAMIQMTALLKDEQYKQERNNIILQLIIKLLRL